MKEEEIKKMLEDTYDYSKEDSYGSMVRDFFSERMRWVMITVWVWFFIFMVAIVISIIFFFMTDQTKFQIMYAAIFVCCTLSIGFLKVLAWVMLQRHGIKREIKRLELRIAELAETIKDK